MNLPDAIYLASIVVAGAATVITFMILTYKLITKGRV